MKHHFEYCDDNRNIMPGFYESILFSTDDIYEENSCIEQNCRDNGEEYVEHDINDFGAFMNEVCKRITDKLIAPMLMEDSKLCDKVTFKEVSSPRQYNWETDKIVLDLNIDLEYLKYLILTDEDMRNGFDLYLAEKYTDYDGFHSYVKNNLEDYIIAERFEDVMIDYYLLTKIYDSKDVVKAAKEESDYPHYIWECREISSECIYEFMEPIKNEE